LNISIDPHSQKNLGHNYADVALLIDSLGVEAINVIGGHIWKPYDSKDQDWERFKIQLQGQKFPQAMWKGDILMGHGTPKRVNDPLPSGVWEPKGKHDFWSTDSAGNHSIVWDGSDESGQPVSSGVYFFKLMCNENFIIGNKMLFLK
jgi:hypothetical protein